MSTRTSTKAKQQFCTCSTHLVHFISLISWLHKHGVNFPYAAFMEDVKTQRLFFSFLNLSAVLRNLTPRKFTCICTPFVLYTFFWQIVSFACWHKSVTKPERFHDFFTAMHKMHMAALLGLFIEWKVHIFLPLYILLLVKTVPFRPM